jgi:hypothetical protein
MTISGACINHASFRLVDEPVDRMGAHGCVSPDRAILQPPDQSPPRSVHVPGRDRAAPLVSGMIGISRGRDAAGLRRSFNCE